MIFSIDHSIWKLTAGALALCVAACGEPVEQVSPLVQARAALASGDGLQAEVILRDQIAAGTSKADVAALLGEAELQQGQLAEAREWLGTGEFSDDTFSHGFHMLARLEMADGNLAAAGAAFDKALERDRKNSDLWVDIARLRYRGGEQAQAVEASEYSVELAPDNPRAVQYRAQLVRDAEGMLAALPWFERALKGNPDDTELLYEYAATLGELGQAHQMLEVVRKIAVIEPSNRRIYYLQAVLAARAGKYELARSLLLRTSQATQNMPAAMLLSGVIDIENGNYASAAQTLERLAAQQPDNLRVQQMLARALAMGGNHTELVYLFAKPAEGLAASPYLQTLVGRSYEALEERDKAARYLDLAARPRTGDLAAMPSAADLSVAELRGAGTGPDALELVRARIMAGQGANASSAVGPFVEKFPGSADALSLAGDAALAGKNYQLAIKQYENASMIRRPWTITRKLIKAYEADGRQDDALTLLAQYFTGDPGNTEAAGLLAQYAIGNEDWVGAAIFLDHALVNGGYRDPHLLSLRAKVALALNDTLTALDAAQTAYQIQPMNIEATRALAEVYRVLGDHEVHTRILEAKLKKLQ